MKSFNFLISQISISSLCITKIIEFTSLSNLLGQLPAILVLKPYAVNVVTSFGDKAILISLAFVQVKRLLGFMNSNYKVHLIRILRGR